MNEKLPPMTVKHAHVELAEAQRVQKTLLCPGPCPHPFMGREANYAVYGRVTSGEVYDYYETLLGLTTLKGIEDIRAMAEIMAAAEIYTKKMIRIWVEVCGLRTFKDQDGVYQRWGPAGDFMMMRVLDYVRELEKKWNIRIIYQHDCKRGDLGATMQGYFDRFLGDLWSMFEIDHAYLDYDTMNVQPLMGIDTIMLKEAKKKNVIPARGLELMREKGKCIILVDKTSNDSGPQYQQLVIHERGGKTLAECIAEDANTWTEQYGLIYDGLSAMGLVNGCTHQSNGEIRALFPTGTQWNPGFGNQSGGFANVMLELIREGKWNGQGSIFTNETAMMYCWQEKFGGTGNPKEVEQCAIRAVNNHKIAEFKAYQDPEVIRAGIRYPFQYNLDE